MNSLFKPLTIFMLSLFLVVGACDEGGIGSEVGECGDDCSSNSTPDGTPPDPDTAEELYVRFLDSEDGEESFEYFEYQVLPTFNASSTCRVDKTETSNQDLSCVIDVNEQDLYFHGMRIEFVIPTGMCDYFTFNNHWHYDQEMGSGPPEIWVRQYRDDEGNPNGPEECFVRNSDGIWYPSDPNLDGLPTVEGEVFGTGDSCGSLSAGADLELWSINTDNFTPRCKYDRSLGGGDNCCRGTYNVTIETLDNSDTSGFDGGDGFGRATEVITDRSYGPIGAGECISGQAVVDDDWPKTSTGWPVGRIYYTREKGISDRYKIKAPISAFHESDNHLVANWHAYVEGVDTRHQHAGNTVVRTSYLPIFYDPIEDRSGDYILAPAQPSYEFHCMNEDFETIHRLRWYIREYNTEAQFQNFIANPVNGTQDADRSGTEGGGGANDCEGFLGNACNDRTDADDYNPDTPGDTPPYDCSSSEGARFGGGLTGCFPFVRE
ncbi:MAG: hypothetical protein KDD40_00415 [Bdellovibrionales bacterium]|nr:hypothetical protein [Bdellovibrionales bacterium]